MATRRALLVGVAAQIVPRAAFAATPQVRSSVDENGRITGACELRVPIHAEAVQRAILDFGARVDESWIVDAVSTYAHGRRGDRLTRGARWDLGVLGVKIRYHTIYEFSPSCDRIDWHLDPEHSNDIEGASGRYELIRDGCATELRYTYTVLARQRVGRRLRLAISRKASRELVEGISTRARHHREGRPPGC